MVFLRASSVSFVTPWLVSVLNRFTTEFTEIAQRVDGIPTDCSACGGKMREE
jgi:hypothetical protein